jgi:ABC-2 type transport system ATP-binding protein
LETVIELKKATKIYKALDFWKSDRTIGMEMVDLSVYRGEVFGLLGLNGAGKTTLMKVLLGLLKPTSGTVGILGGSADDIGIRAKIGYMPELPYFPKYLKVKEVMEYFSDIFGIPKSAQKQKIGEILETVKLGDKADVQVRALSKGMQGRLGLAQAILNEPDLLFLDEPMSGLDPMGYKETRDIILDLHKKGKTIFFNSHILGEVEKVCDRVAVMHRAGIREVKELPEVMAKYGSLEKYFIGVVEGGAGQ